LFGAISLDPVVHRDGGGVRWFCGDGHCFLFLAPSPPYSGERADFD
jgi:hypothetical protein